MFKDIILIIFFNINSISIENDRLILNISDNISIKLTRASIKDTKLTTIKEFFIILLFSLSFPIRLNITSIIAKGYTNCKKGPVSLTIDSTPRIDNNKETIAIVKATSL